MTRGRERGPPRELSDGDRTSAFLLSRLRRANSRIGRLRAVAIAAQEGGPEQVRAALAALRKHDLDR